MQQRSVLAKAGAIQKSRFYSKGRFWLRQVLYSKSRFNATKVGSG